jgi:hypothetical protein
MARPRLMWRVDGDDSAGLFAHVLPQAVLARPRAGITPDITAPTRVGMPAQAAAQGPTSCTTRDRTRGSSGAGRRWRSGRGG